MLKRKHFFFAGTIAFLLFILFSFFVHKNLFTSFDFNMTVRLQDHITRRLDDFFSVLSDVGQFEVMIVVLIIILVIARRWLSGLLGIALFGFLHVFELYGKFFVSHLPPPQFLLRTKQLVNFPQFSVRAQNSYPSGHAGRALFISTILAVMILQSKRLPVAAKVLLCGLLVVYDAIMLVSRVYLGEHWSSDVIGGTLLGLALGLIEGGILIKKDAR